MRERIGDSLHAGERIGTALGSYRVEKELGGAYLEDPLSGTLSFCGFIYSGFYDQAVFK